MIRLRFPWKKWIFFCLWQFSPLYIPKERQDPFALVALYKRVTVSKSLPSLFTKEWPWANRSRRSFKKRATGEISSFSLANRYFTLSITCWHVDNHLSMGKVAMFNKVFWLDLPLKTASVWTKFKMKEAKLFIFILPMLYTSQPRLFSRGKDLAWQTELNILHSRRCIADI